MIEAEGQDARLAGFLMAVDHRAGPATAVPSLAARPGAGSRSGRPPVLTPGLPIYTDSADIALPPSATPTLHASRRAGAVRVSFHLYNDARDATAMADLLDELRRG